MKLYGGLVGPRAKKIFIAAEYAKVDLTLEEINPRQASEEALKELKKKNPNAKVPVLETPEGPIYESNAILRYIARISKGEKLYGNTKFEESQVDQYLDWCSTLLEPAYYAYIPPYFGYARLNAETHPAAKEKLFKALKVLDDKLHQTKYLVGNNVTVADCHIACLLLNFFRYLADQETQKQFPKLTKYIEELAHSAVFTKICGKFALCKTALPVYTGPLPEPEEAKKPEPKKAAPQPKKEAAPAPKKKEAKKKDDDDEEDDDMPKEEKKKNPLDSLPPSSFNLFDFKTLFVNAPNKHEALATFLEQYDPQGYSVWHMEYDKAEGEGKVVFLTSNLMNGFLQRLETFRKYAFGVVGVYGDEPELQIRGVWVWRGNEIPFEIKDHPSGEWYKFKKLDVVGNEADKKLLEEYWCKQNEDEDIVEGLRARDVKYYK
jgi:elongation factor 1-gamma